MKLYRTKSGWAREEGGKAFSLARFSLDEFLAGSSATGPVGPAVPDIEHSTLAPIQSQEVWAAGVTYLRSKAARMEESNFSATAYDRVYDAPRPELFFKATASRCVGSGGALKLRDDSKWMVPEPELVLVINASKKLVGFTIGNDLSCRDIEGENLLYLPQAKVWDRCCGIGPAILVTEDEKKIREEEISVEIIRGSAKVFAGSTSIGRIKRSFEDLIEYLFRNQTFPVGVFLFTGTGVVPPDDFTLKKADEVRIAVPSIGVLSNICD